MRIEKMQAMKKIETVPPFQIGISIFNKEHDEILDRVIYIYIYSSRCHWPKYKCGEIKE